MAKKEKEKKRNNPLKKNRAKKKKILLSLKIYKYLKGWDIQISGKGRMGWWGSPYCGGAVEIPGFVGIIAASPVRKLLAMNLQLR